MMPICFVCRIREHAALAVKAHAFDATLGFDGEGPPAAVHDTPLTFRDDESWHQELSWSYRRDVPDFTLCAH